MWTILPHDGHSNTLKRLNSFHTSLVLQWVRGSLPERLRVERYLRPVEGSVVNSDMVITLWS